MTTHKRPHEHFFSVLERACFPPGRQPNLANRAKLRRALRANGSMATVEALSVIGGALGDCDTARMIEMKAGVAALYATHAQPGARAREWATVALLLGEAKRARDGISDDRAGRELLGLLRTTDPAEMILRSHRALTLAARAAGVQPAELDWHRALSDLDALTGDDQDRRNRTKDRWARDFARIPASNTPAVDTNNSH